MRQGISGISSIISHEAEQTWNLSRRAAVLFFIAPFVAVLVVGILRAVNKPLLVGLTDEDGLAEWVQVFCFIIGLLFSLAIARQLSQDRRGYLALLYLLVGFGLFFISGEELAWGQRIFNFTTPEDLAVINEKSEVSVHNISLIAPWFTVGKLVAGVYGVAGCWVLFWLRRRREVSILEPFVVPFFLSSTFLIVLIQRILRLTILRDIVPLGYSEIEETFLAYGVAAFIVLLWRRLRLQQGLS